MTLNKVNVSILSSTTIMLSGAFFLLSLFSGVWGGILTLPLFRGYFSEGTIVVHAILMTFFVMSPATLGGVAQYYLPKALGCEKTMLPFFSIVGWLLLGAGILSLSYNSVVGLIFWSLGILAVAIDVIATIIEGREIRFSDLPSLVWSLLGVAATIIVVVPVLLAFIIKGISPAVIVQMLRLPEMSLLLTPALGIVAQVVSLGKENSRRGFMSRIAPYAFSVMGTVTPLIWMNMLCGGTPASALTIVLLIGQVFPGIAILTALWIDSWSYFVDHTVPVLWSLGASVLLALTWISMAFSASLLHFLPSDIAYRFVGGDVAHQASVFGCLMALSSAFYAWFLRDQYKKNVFYHIIGALHAIITFSGVIFTLPPQWNYIAFYLILLSLLGYIFVGFLAWKSILMSCEVIPQVSVSGEE